MFKPSGLLLKFSLLTTDWTELVQKITVENSCAFDLLLYSFGLFDKGNTFFLPEKVQSFAFFVPQLAVYLALDTRYFIVSCWSKI